MARKREITTEERLQQEKERGLREIKDKIHLISEPSYYFNVGDRVKYGALVESVVEEILYEGKAYVLKCKTIKYETYRVAPWVSVRPIDCETDTNFSENQEVRLSYDNTTIDNLLHMNYSAGIDFDPEYQRGYVWSQEDKELLIDSVFKNIDIGKFTLIHLADEEWIERNIGYEILDGKQRLKTLIEFYENKLVYKGKRYNDLSKADERTFLNHSVAVAKVYETDKKTILKYFLMLNRTGKAMDKQHLEHIENMLKEFNEGRQST